MSEIIISASNLLNNISHIFSGTYKSVNEDYISIKKEIYDMSITTIEDDRKNTHADMGRIGSDFKKAVKEHGQK